MFTTTNSPERRTTETHPMKTQSKIITAGSSADQHQRLLKVYLKVHHKQPPSDTLELTSWANSEEGQRALNAEAKSNPQERS